MCRAKRHGFEPRRHRVHFIIIIFCMISLSSLVLSIRFRNRSITCKYGQNKEQILVTTSVKIYFFVL